MPRNQNGGKSRTAGAPEVRSGSSDLESVGWRSRMASRSMIDAP